LTGPSPAGNPEGEVCVLGCAQRRMESRVCGSCKRKENLGETFKKCGGCHSVLYCSVDCQKNDWKEHRLRCKKVPQATSPASGVSQANAQSTPVKPTPEKQEATKIQEPSKAPPVQNEPTSPIPAQPNTQTSPSGLPAGEGPVKKEQLAHVLQSLGLPGTAPVRPTVSPTSVGNGIPSREADHYHRMGMDPRGIEREMGPMYMRRGMDPGMYGMHPMMMGGHMHRGMPRHDDDEMPRERPLSEDEQVQQAIAESMRSLKADEEKKKKEDEEKKKERR